MKLFEMRLEFKLADFWVGVFWKVKDVEAGTGAKWRYLHIWICLLPCFPLHLTFLKPLNNIAKRSEYGHG